MHEVSCIADLNNFNKICVCTCMSEHSVAKLIHTCTIVKYNTLNTLCYIVCAITQI